MTVHLTLCVMIVLDHVQGDARKAVIHRVTQDVVRDALLGAQVHVSEVALHVLLIVLVVVTEPVMDHVMELV